MRLAKYFLPTFYVPNVRVVDSTICHQLEIQTLLLDIDNTLAVYGSQEPYLGIEKWLDGLRAGGINLIIVSNNRKRRVKKFAERLNLPYIANAKKPFPAVFLKTLRRFDCLPCNGAVVGDQLFTDVLGANLAGIRSILVTNITPESGPFFRLKRRLEKWILFNVDVEDDDDDL